MDGDWCEVVFYWILILYFKVDGVSAVARQAANARETISFHLKVLIVPCLLAIALPNYYFLTCFEIATLFTCFLESH